MGILFFLIILGLVLGDDKRRSMAFKAIKYFFGAMILMSLFVNFLNIPGMALLALIGAGFAFKKASDKRKAEQNESEVDYREVKRRWEQQKANGTPRYTSQSEYVKEHSSTVLPKGAEKRKRLVQNFNEKYNLTLTDDEIKRIVDSSYLSDAWRKEIEAMTRNYESVYEWFAGDTDWLRIYVHAFQVQTISSDFNLQKDICIKTFDQVMTYAESFEHLTLDERIHKVNEKFFTVFDETSFMAVYRFMEAQGRHYDLLKVDILRNEDELERELEKTKMKYKEV